MLIRTQRALGRKMSKEFHKHYRDVSWSNPTACWDHKGRSGSMHLSETELVRLENIKQVLRNIDCEYSYLNRMALFIYLKQEQII